MSETVNIIGGRGLTSTLIGAMLFVGGPAASARDQDPRPPAATAPAETPAGAAGRAAGSATATETPSEAAPLQRVIVVESRRREVSGFVEFEDEQMLFLRDRAGRIERFHKDGIVAVIRLVEPAPGQRGIVFLRSGQQRTGVVLEDTFDKVVLEISGVRATLPRDLVHSVKLYPTFDEQYRALKERLRPDMPGRHLELCQWLADQERFDLAQVELDEMLRVHESPAAEKLRRVVSARLALAARPAPAPRTKPERPARYVERGPLLTDADVNLIRVYEIDFRRPPKVELEHATIERLLVDYATSPLLPTSPTQRKALHRIEPIRIVEELLFKLQARELYGEIKVLTEPYALNLFRQRVHDGWLMNNCATSRCHGGPDAGRFFLHQRNHKSERVRYTNMLILQRLEIEPEWSLVNYETPLDSLIIQYGLPRTVARKPHPPARGWQPVFRTTDDRMVRRTVDWIEAMMKPRSPYPVAFDPNEYTTGPETGGTDNRR